MATSENTAAATSSFINLISDPSFVVDENLTIVDANQNFFDTFSISAKSVIGKKVCEEVCGNPLCGTKDCPITKAKRIHKANSFDTIYKHDETFTHYKSTATPLNGPGRIHESDVVLSVNRHDRGWDDV